MADGKGTVLTEEHHAVIARNMTDKELARRMAWMVTEGKITDPYVVEMVKRLKLTHFL